MKPHKHTPEIRNAVFWDVNYDELDFEKYDEFIISRVFNRGNLQEIADIVNYYGKERVKKTVQESPFMEGHGIDVASALLTIPRINFKCYTNQQFRQS